jgi:hypothetical protein
MIINKWLVACLKSIPDPTGSQGSAGAVFYCPRFLELINAKYATLLMSLQLHIKSGKTDACFSQRRSQQDAKRLSIDKSTCAKQILAIYGLVSKARIGS